LRRHEAQPNKLVKFVLVRRQITLHALRRAVNVRRVDRFVRLLRSFYFAFVKRRGCGGKTIAVLFLNILLRLRLQLFGHIETVRSHISYQTYDFAADFNAFVKRLGGKHGFLGRKTYFIISVLLH